MESVVMKINEYDVLIDNDDYEKVNSIKWHVYITKGLIYFRTWSYIGRKQTLLFLHQLVAKTPKGMKTDHANGNTLDNRKCNLRICTAAENTRNQKRRTDNSSGYKGVSWAKRRGKWVAQIIKDGKHHFLGHFSTPEEAHNAYCEASKNYHGEFGRVS